MKLLVILVLLSLAMANLRLNFKYRDVLEGTSKLSDLKAREIYHAFQSSYIKDEYRFGVFKHTLQKIITHNANNLTWSQGINDFSDQTWEEFKASKLMAPQACSATNSFKLPLSRVSAPSVFQWNNYGVVTPVKNQLSCGSCWSFSTVGTLEAHWNILNKGKNVLFSQQQLVDCAGNFQNYGCEGGLPSQAYQYIKYAGGIQQSSSYSYVGKDGKCAFKPQNVKGYVKYGSYNITAGDEQELADRLYNAGPIAIAYQVMSDFKDYLTGVYVPSTTCGTTPLDVNHAVVATGYGTSKGLPFWNVKNSWGTAWGMSGYFQITRNNNTCAVSQCNSYPLIDRPQFQVDQLRSE